MLRRSKVGSMDGRFGREDGRDGRGKTDSATKARKVGSPCVSGWRVGVAVWRDRAGRAGRALAWRTACSG